LGDYFRQNTSYCQFNNSSIWIIESPIELGIRNKIESIGIPLEKWGINIYRGILTGCNEVFVISEKQRRDILNNCVTEKEFKITSDIIRPILRGRDIKRYEYNCSNLWLIWIPWHFPMHLDKAISGSSTEAERLFEKEYPSVYKYLSTHKDELMLRNKAETGIRYEWYALQRWGADYWRIFSTLKSYGNE
jgi:hypothetical protein